MVRDMVPVRVKVSSNDTEKGNTRGKVSVRVSGADLVIPVFHTDQLTATAAHLSACADSGFL